MEFTSKRKCLHEGTLESVAGLRSPSLLPRETKRLSFWRLRGSRPSLLGSCPRRACVCSSFCLVSGGPALWAAGLVSQNDLDWVGGPSEIWDLVPHIYELGDLNPAFSVMDVIVQFLLVEVIHLLKGSELQQGKYLASSELCPQR